MAPAVCLRYEPVTKALFGYERASTLQKAQLEKFKTTESTLPNVREVLATGLRVAQADGTKQGYTIVQPMGLMMPPNSSAAVLMLQTSRDEPECEKFCGIMLMFDSKTGTVIDVTRPLQATPNELTGNFISRWLLKLHYGHPIGLWYQIVVCVVGIVIALLSGTGIYIWWKKRKARKHSEAKKAEAELAADVAT